MADAYNTWPFAKRTWSSVSQSFYEKLFPTFHNVKQKSWEQKRLRKIFQYFQVLELNKKKHTYIFFIFKKFLHFLIYLRMFSKYIHFSYVFYIYIFFIVWICNWLLVYNKGLEKQKSCWCKAKVRRTWRFSTFHWRWV